MIVWISPGICSTMGLCSIVEYIITASIINRELKSRISLLVTNGIIYFYEGKHFFVGQFTMHCTELYLNYFNICMKLTEVAAPKWNKGFATSVAIEWGLKSALQNGTQIRWKFVCSAIHDQRFEALRNCSDSKARDGCVRKLVRRTRTLPLAMIVFSWDFY